MKAIRRGVLLPILAVVAAIIGFVALTQRNAFLDNVLRDWAISAIASASDSVYHLSVSRLRVTAFPGRIVVDTLQLTTDTARNEYRAVRLPVLTVKATGCRVTGINTLRLVFQQGLVASSIGCDSITASALETVRPEVPVQSSAASARPGVPILGDSLHLPGAIPVIIVGRTSLPRLALQFTQRFADSTASVFDLQRLAIELRNTRIDPSVPLERRRPLMSEVALLSADTLQVLGSGQTAFSMGRLRVNLTDSSVALDSVRLGPVQPDAEWTRQQKVRRDRVRVTLDSARFHGVDFAKLRTVAGPIGIRRVTVSGLTIDVLSDKRLPNGPSHKRASPQQWIAGLGHPLAIDTIEVRDSRVAYHEHGVGRVGTGTMTWERIESQIVGARTIPVRRGDAVPPMVMHAIAYLQGKGKIDVTFTVPLTATQFDMAYKGQMGPMDMTALNSFIAEALPAHVVQGSLQVVTYDVTIRKGRSVGRIIPKYADFKVDIEDKQAGFFKSIGFAFATLYANAFKLRHDNPDGDKPPRVGLIDVQWNGRASLPQVLWFALRQGLGRVFIK